MHKWIKISIIISLLILCLCQKQYQYYTHSFIGYFDTVTTYITYAKNQTVFQKQCDDIEKQLNYYHQLFDKYHSYQNINNIYTINQNAGQKAIQVDHAIIELIDLSIQRYQTISSKVNIAFGSVLNIWHTYQEKAQSQGGIGSVPRLEELKKAFLHTNIVNIQVDKNKNTVYIKDTETSLDVGATAKGYAMELIKQDLISKGVDNFLLSGGGNVTSYGKRKINKQGDFYLKDCQNHYCVGIESPRETNYSHDEDSDNEAVLVVWGQSVVTSGGYQRFYEDIEGIRYHHLIDPETLYPASYLKSVSVVCEDSGLADFLSTALFLTQVEEGIALVESLDGAEAIWLLNDGKIKMSSGLRDNQNIYIIEKERLEE